jgi:hypothetical protein
MKHLFWRRMLCKIIGHDWTDWERKMVHDSERPYDGKGTPIWPRGKMVFVRRRYCMRCLESETR